MIDLDLVRSVVPVRPSRSDRIVLEPVGNPKGARVLVLTPVLAVLYAVINLVAIAAAGAL